MKKDEKDVKEDQKALLVDNEDKSNFEKSSSEKSTIQVKKIKATIEDDEEFQPRSKKTDEVFSL